MCKSIMNRGTSEALKNVLHLISEAEYRKLLGIMRVFFQFFKQFQPYKVCIHWSLWMIKSGLVTRWPCCLMLNVEESTTLLTKKPIKYLKQWKYFASPLFCYIYVNLKIAHWPHEMLRVHFMKAVCYVPK